VSGTGAPAKRRVDAHLALVRKVASRLRRQLPGHFELDDLVAYGTEGLIQAAERYDDRSGTPFPHYAYYRIRGAMLDGVRRMGLKRSQVERWKAEERVTAYLANLADREAGAPPAAPTVEDDLRAVLAALQGAAICHVVSLDAAEAEVADSQGAADEHLLLGETRARVKAALAALPERERAFVHKLYYEGKSLTEAGAEVGVSKSWASRLHARAIDLLRAELREPD
jgi:RNA polymerase sigma factor for flagellar operon FliA